MRLFINLLFCFLSTLLLAQEGATLQLKVAMTSHKNVSTPIDIPLQKVAPFLAYSFNWESSNGVEQMEIRFSKNKKAWTAWTIIEQDGHANRADGKAVSTLRYADKAMRFFQLRTQNVSNQDIDIRLFSPGISTPQEPRIVTQITSRNCTTRFPELLERDQWCPAGNCPTNSTDPASTVPTHLIIHHSAGPNGANDWAAVVRSFWDFHVNTNGWSDIGYNYLVDPNGVLYEGRGNNVLGAHYCGKNQRTMGVCVIGDFTNIQPTDEARAMLTEILAWKACDRDIDPMGASTHQPYNEVQWNIAGHRDGCNTSCPGDAFYPQIPDVRQDVVDYIASGGNFLAAPTDLQAVLQDDNSIAVSWIDNSVNETAFLLEKSVLYPNNFQLVATLEPDVTDFIDPDITLENRYYYRLRAINETDTTAYTDEIEVLTVVNTQTVYWAEETVQISPNPFNERVSVFIENEWTGILNIEVFQSNGMQVLQHKNVQKTSGNGQFIINLSKYPQGIYFIKITQGEQEIYRKIVKQ